jgi:hypothetical protein
MSQPDTTDGADGDGDRGESAEIQDVEELTQRLEIRSLTETRQQVTRVRNKAKEQIVSDDVNTSETKTKGAEIYLDVVKAYAMELSPILRTHRPELWNETELITAVVPFDKDSVDDSKSILDYDPDSYRLTVTGINELLSTDFPVECSFEARTSDTVQVQTQTKEQEYRPSFVDIDQIVLELDTAKHELGCGLQVNETADVAQIDYSDIE